MNTAHTWTLDSVNTPVSSDPPKSSEWRALFNYQLNLGASVGVATQLCDSVEARARLQGIR